jgi:hypothetical protein
MAKWVGNPLPTDAGDSGGKGLPPYGFLCRFEWEQRQAEPWD